MDPKNLPGNLKVAILIHSLGKEMSENILASLSESERQSIEEQMPQLSGISGDIVEKVAKEFVEKAEKGKGRWLSGADAGNRGTAPELSNLASLGSKDPDDLVDLIKDEHPQTIAIILVHLKTSVAGQVLSRLPDEIKTDVAVRIASSTRFSAEMVEEMNRVFGDIIKEKRSIVTHEIGGVEFLADMLNRIGGMRSQFILDNIEEDDPVLASEIKQKMFVFDDITLVDDRGFQQVLRRIDVRELAMALKAATETVREKVFKNLSERAGEMLKEEMEVLGPVRMKEVEHAQQLLLKIIQDMESAGELIVSRGGDDELIE